MMIDNGNNQGDAQNIGNPKDIGAFYMNRPQGLGVQPERRRFSPGMAAIGVLIIFGVIIWQAYPRGSEKYEDMDVPLVKADVSPYKLEPTEPGGMVVPHQDSTVFAPLEGADAARATPEQVLPEPEEPIERGEEIIGLPETGSGMQSEQRDASAAPGGEEPSLNLGQIEASPKTTEVLAAVSDEAETPVAVPPAKTPEKKAPVPAAAKKTETASAANAAKKAASVAPASGRSVYIQLGSFKDEAAANKAWSLLKKKYLSVIGSLEPRIEKADLGAKGVFWRLQAGAVSEAEGGRICGDLKAKGESACIIAK